MNQLKALFNFLNSLGKVTKPKKSNAKGVIVYNPSHFQLSEVEHLAEECGFGVIYKPTPSDYEGRTIPPSLFVGVTANELSEEEGLAFLSDLQ